MDRIYPTPTIFIDDSEPDLNAENLNKITNGLSALDKRVAVDLLSESLAVTVSGEKAADATVGKVLNDKITQINSSLTTLNGNMTGALRYLGNLTECTDLNVPPADYGICLVAAGAANSPILNNNAGIMFYHTAGGSTSSGVELVILRASAGIYTRSRSGGTWSQWYTK